MDTPTSQTTSPSEADPKPWKHPIDPLQDWDNEDYLYMWGLAREYLTKQLGRVPTDKEVADEMGW